jgi:hypothetical protein
MNDSPSETIRWLDRPQTGNQRKPADVVAAEPRPLVEERLWSMLSTRSGQDHLLDQLPQEFAVHVWRGERPSLKEMTDTGAVRGRPAWMCLDPLEATVS